MTVLRRRPRCGAVGNNGRNNVGNTIGGNSTTGLMFSACILLFFLVGEISALMCFKDISGIRMRDDDEPVDVKNFEKYNCSLNGTGKIEKVKTKAAYSMISL